MSFECTYLNRSLMLTPTSEIRPCCRFDISRYNPKEFIWDHMTSLEDFYKKEIFQKIRKQAQAGEKIEGCHRCYREEEMGIASMRQKDFPLVLEEGLENTVGLSVIELGVGRTCNLKCRSCDPYFSTKWDSDAEVVFKPVPHGEKILDLNVLSANNFSQTKVLKITGGEPFYHSSFESFLRRLFEAGYAQQIEIEIFSNATRMPSREIQKILSSFRKCTISLSIDAHASRNTYIRHPSRWEDIERTVSDWSELLKLGQIDVLNFAVTVSIFNVLSLFELFKWCSEASPKAVVLLQTVQDPKHLNVSCWPRRIRQKILDIFLKQKEAYVSSHKLAPSLLKRIQKIEKMLNASDESKDIQEIFWRETKALDQRRHEEFSHVFPELHHLLNAPLDA